MLSHDLFIWARPAETLALSETTNAVIIEVNATHSAGLNRTDVTEFAGAMRHCDLDTEQIVGWVMKGQYGLPNLARKLERP